MKNFLPFLLLSCCSLAAQPLPYSLAGSVYLQNFDGLPASGSFSPAGKGPLSLSAPLFNGIGLTGWQYMMAAGSGSAAAFATGTGSSTGNAVYSFGATGSAERALGSLSSGTGIYAFGLVLTNQTGGPLNSLSLSFTAEQWRRGGSGNKNTWAFRYKTGLLASIDATDLTAEPALNFNSLTTTGSAGALNGNLPENQQEVHFTLGSFVWKPGEQLLLRWDDADEPGNDDAVAIDNLRLTASLASGLPMLSGTAATAITAHSASVGARINDNYSDTRFWLALDTSASFTHGVSVRGTDTLVAGSGTTNITLPLSGLLSGKTYFFQMFAQNANGIVPDSVLRFTTQTEPPTVQSLPATVITSHSAILSGKVLAEGSAPVTEKGFVWSAHGNPTISDTKLIAGTGPGAFSVTADSMPAGTVLYARAYALSAAGISYGDSASFRTKTFILTLSAPLVRKTHAASVIFTGKTANPVAGLQASNFSFTRGSIADALVNSVAVAGNAFTVTVSTGTSDGIIGLQLSTDAGIQPSIENSPFTADRTWPIDKTPPQVTAVSIPDRPMKIGDSVPVMVAVSADADLLKLNTGQVAGYGLNDWTKINDTSYHAYLIIAASGRDLSATDSIPVSITLSDSAGNSGSYQVPITHDNDPVDANKPYILSGTVPPAGTYKLGDTLDFAIHFSEAVSVNTQSGSPALSLNVGSKTKTAIYTGGNNSPVLTFRYTVQPNDIAPGGIKPAGTITLNGAEITDAAQNPAIVTINNMQSANTIVIDGAVAAISMVTVPDPGMYKAGDTLEVTLLFTDKVFVTMKTDTPSIKITVGSTAKNLRYAGGSGSAELLFRYIVQRGDLDKNGITMGTSVTLVSSTVTNGSGNPAALTLKNTGSLSDVNVDAVGPLFGKNTDTAILCENSGQISISTVLQAKDDESGEFFSWTILTPPINGTTILPVAGIPSNGKALSPTGAFYIPSKDFYGEDSALVQVSDGLNADQKKLFFQVQPAIKNNLVNAREIICASNPSKITGTLPSGGNGSYQYTWETSADGANFSKAAGNNMQQNYTPVSSGGMLWIRRKSSSGYCEDISDTLSVKLVTSGLWLGTTGNAWNDGKNWCGNTVPDGVTDVWVYSGAAAMPLISDSAACMNLTLAQDANMQLTGMLRVNGDLAINGWIDARQGSCSLNGISNQVLPGRWFTDHSIGRLVIGNSSAVILTDSLTITQSLSLKKGRFTTQNHLTFAENAIVGPMPAGTAIEGNINVNYPLTRSNAKMVLMGHPFASAISIQPILKNLFPVDKNAPANPAIKTGSLAFGYDPLNGNDSTGVEAGYFLLNNVSDSLGWKPRSGMRFEPADFSEQGTDSTAQPLNNGPVKLSGILNSGDQEMVLLKGSLPSYNLLVNPYLSNLDLSRISRGPDAGSFYWYWDPHLGIHGGYSCFPFRAKNILPPFSCFFVKASGIVSNKILINEYCRTMEPVPARSPATDFDDIFYAELHLESDTIFWDRLLILATDSAKTYFDKNDGEKFWNADANFYSLDSRGKLLSVDARPLDNETSIPLGLSVQHAGQYSIRVAVAKLPQTNTLMLHDKLLDKWLPLNKDSFYTFSTTADSATYGNGRFEITSRKKSIQLENYPDALHAKLSPVPAKDKVMLQFVSPSSGNTTIRLVNANGMIIQTLTPGIIKEGQFEIPVSTLPSGIYFIQIVCGDYRTVLKLIK